MGAAVIAPIRYGQIELSTPLYHFHGRMRGTGRDRENYRGIRKVITVCSGPVLANQLPTEAGNNVMAVREIEGWVD